MTEKWNRRFLEIARLWASFSKDPSTRVGCVVMDRDKNQLSSGFNSFPRSVEDLPERYADRSVKYRMICHAEANAVAAAARNGHSLSGAILYTTSFPCSQCAALIIQAGITEVVHSPSPDYEQRWQEDVAISRLMFSEAGVSITRIELSA